jgi:hypothetical protein
MRWIVLCAFVCLTLLTMVSAASAETEVFELQHLQARDIEATVRAVLDEQAKVVSYKNSLVVVASPDDLAVAAVLIERLDQPSQMLRISVDQGRDDSSWESQQAVAGRLGNDTVIFRTGAPERPERGTADVTIHSGDSHVQLRAEESRSQETRRVSQFLMVMEGQAGRLSVGKAVPFTDRLVELSGRHGRVVTSTEYQRVDTGFYVFPELYGDVVQLDIQPYMSFLDRSRPDEIIFQDLSTKVRVPVGEWFDLGGHMTTQDELSRAILSRGRADGRTDSNVKVKVDRQ